MKVYGFKLINSTSFGDFMTVEGFIQKTALRTTVIHSKRANQQQQVILLATPTKVDPRRKWIRYLEYFRVKATVVFVRLRIYLCALINTNMRQTCMALLLVSFAVF